MEGFLESAEVLDSRQFMIAVKRLADSLAFGTDRSPYIGSGLEYHQSRPYQFGDSIKAIDWRVTARTGKVHVKEYEAIKRLPVWILVDTSASMTISSTSRSKYEVAVFVAGGVAMASLEAIRPVGFLGVGGRGLMRPESLSKDQVHGWLHALRKYRFDEPTNLAKRVNELAARLPQRSQIIVLSDLHEVDSQPYAARLRQFFKGRNMLGRGAR